MSSELKQDADGFEKYYRLRQERLDAIVDQYICIQFFYVSGEPNSVVLEIEDSGDGFDVSRVMHKIKGDQDSHGRGMSLLNSLCSTLEYKNDGRKVRAVYELRQH